MNATISNFEGDLAELESAEDFLEYFAVDYDPRLLQVVRLHVLQRFHNYLGRYASDQNGRNVRNPSYAEYRVALQNAYDDFVRSDVMTEKVFSVLKRAAGISTIPLSAIGRRKSC